MHAIESILIGFLQSETLEIDPVLIKGKSYSKNRYRYDPVDRQVVIMALTLCLK